MTRRIALAILATIGLSLVVGGLAVYWTARTILLAELDATLLKRAMSLPEVSGGGGDGGAHGGIGFSLPSSDRFMIVNDQGQTIARVGPGTGKPVHPQIVRAAFQPLGDGQRVRSLTLRIRPGTGSAAQQQQKPITVVYSTSAEGFDRVLNRLALMLALFSACGGLAAALVAVRVARAAIRPLLDAAEHVGEIDESRLDRRIEVGALPSELKPVADRLNDMLTRLEATFARRKQFFADTSHELRTPIAAMLTTLEVARRRERTAGELNQTLDRCLTDARLLNRLAGALLEQARGERGDDDAGTDAAAAAAARRKAVVHVASLARECISALMPLAEQKQLALGQEVPEPLYVCVEESRLRSILINLLSNAIEYNRPGGEGRACLRAFAEGRDATIEVQDTGVGISREDLQHVFEPFFRASRSRSGPGDHLGLGLYLVKTHAAALGGHCRAESEPGQGSKFIVYMPDVVADPTSLSSSQMDANCSAAAAAR
jgi:signal transduction histidine kinase